MKLQGLVLLIASLVPNDRLAYAYSANPVLQRSSQDSTAASSTLSNDATHATPGQGSNQKEATRAGKSAAGRHHSNKSYVRSQARLPMPRRPMPARNRGLSRAQGPLHVEQPTLSKPRVVSGKIANAHVPAIRPRAGSAIGGQQLRRSRNLAAIPVALDGSANGRRNTQAINGSEIHLRH